MASTRFLDRPSSLSALSMLTEKASSIFSSQPHLALLSKSLYLTDPILTYILSQMTTSQHMPTDDAARYFWEVIYIVYFKEHRREWTNVMRRGSTAPIPSTSNSGINLTQRHNKPRHCGYPPLKTHYHRTPSTSSSSSSYSSDSNSSPTSSIPPSICTTNTSTTRITATSTTTVLPGSHLSPSRRFKTKVIGWSIGLPASFSDSYNNYRAHLSNRNDHNYNYLSRRGSAALQHGNAILPCLEILLLPSTFLWEEMDEATLLDSVEERFGRELQRHYDTHEVLKGYKGAAASSEKNNVEGEGESDGDEESVDSDICSRNTREVVGMRSHVAAVHSGIVVCFYTWDAVTGRVGRLQFENGWSGSYVESSERGKRKKGSTVTLRSLVHEEMEERCRGALDLEADADAVNYVIRYVRDSAEWRRW